MTFPPERSYKIRQHMFQIQPAGGEAYKRVLICARPKCWKPCGEGAWLSEDMATLVEACRQHEITEHSTVVTWEQFNGGYRVLSLVPPGPWPLAETALPDLLAEPEHLDYEWLGENLGPAGPSVTVRDPHALAEWEAQYAAYMAAEATRG